MNRAEANKQARKIYEQWKIKHDEIEKQAKEEGNWAQNGLDGNNHLFKKLNEETKSRLKLLQSKITKD